MDQTRWLSILCFSVIVEMGPFTVAGAKKLLLRAGSANVPPTLAGCTSMSSCYKQPAIVDLSLPTCLDVVLPETEVTRLDSNFDEFTELDVLGTLRHGVTVNGYFYQQVHVM